MPGIFAYYVTGAITASGGSWNAAIVAEVASWGNTKLDGARAGRLYRRGDRQGRHGARGAGRGGHVRASSLLFNRLLWRPLYAYSERHLKLG